jgi:hypothetical protein
LNDEDASRLQGVLSTPRFARFIDKTSPVFDILLTLKPSIAIFGPTERSLMYTDQQARMLKVNSLNELEYFDLLQLLKDQASLPKHFMTDDY